jgi:hypothetical protein
VAPTKVIVPPVIGLIPDRGYVMSGRRLARCRWLLALILVAAPPGAASARGEDPGGRDDEPEAAAKAPATDAPVFAVERGATREAWAARLSTEVARIDQVCRLSAAQKKKLELAGRGDIKRAFDRVDEAGRGLRAAKRVAGAAKAGEAELAEVQRQFAQGLFRDGSLFAKTIPSVLSADQLARYRADRVARRRFRHRALVDLVVDVLATAAGCSHEQRERLARLLLEKTRLSTRADQDFVIVLAQAVTLPESQLRPIFDEAQWRALSRLAETLGKQLQDELRQAVLEPDDLAEPIAARDGSSATGKK